MLSAHMYTTTQHSTHQQHAPHREMQGEVSARAQLTRRKDRAGVGWQLAKVATGDLAGIIAWHRRKVGGEDETMRRARVGECE